MNGQLESELHPVPRYSSRKGRRPSAALLLAAFALLVSFLAPLAMGAKAQEGSTRSTGGVAGEDWTPPRTVYIPETGHSIDGVFLDYWRANSGIASYGYPISPEIEQDGRIVQYYTYARFEYWPEDPNGNIVQLGNLGTELRPPALQRTIIPRDGKATADKATREIAAMANAWLPPRREVGGEGQHRHLALRAGDQAQRRPWLQDVCGRASAKRPTSAIR